MNIAAAAAIESILHHCDDYEWTTMGFGMIRTYLDSDKRFRLNVWDDRLQVANVSTVHDHPWSFTSWIFAGTLNNTIFDVHELGRVTRMRPTHAFHYIKTGEGGGPVEAPQCAVLKPRPKLIYRPGSEYSQVLDQVHETLYERGTVTLNDRSTPTESYTARVFWPYGTEWIDAMPRKATGVEIANAVEAALALFERDRPMARTTIHPRQTPTHAPIFRGDDHGDSAHGAEFPMPPRRA